MCKTCCLPESLNCQQRVRKTQSVMSKPVLIHFHGLLALRKELKGDMKPRGSFCAWRYTLGDRSGSRRTR